MERIKRKGKNITWIVLICCTFNCACTNQSGYVNFYEYDSLLVDTLQIYANIDTAMYNILALNDDTVIIKTKVNLRDTLQKVYTSYIGVTEATGNNDGPEIKKFLATCGLPEGNFWCVAFVYSCFLEAGIDPQIRSPAWSPSWFADSTKIVYRKGLPNVGFKAKPGMVGGSFFKSKGRIAHGYFIDHESKNNFYCVDGNGNNKMSNNGGEVLRVIRPKSLVFRISDYIND